VANSGGNEVLVYPGLGNGQFGPVQRYHTGQDPAGITLSDLNGDGLMDVLVANRGSNDVAILFGQRGSPDFLRFGSRTPAGGSGPVAVTVAPGTSQDATGHVIPNLIVTNSQSNNVSLLPGRGQGFFSPGQFFGAVGTDPQQSFVGNFDGLPGLDLVTINAGSNDLTLFSNIGSTPLGAGETIPSDGETPVAALVGDFNDDGFNDLIVANNDDGKLALLLGGPDGLHLMTVVTRGDLPHPTDLQLAGINPGSLEIYVAEEGMESATFVRIPVPTLGGSNGLTPVLLIAEENPGLPTGTEQEPAPNLLSLIIGLTGARPGNIAAGPESGFGENEESPRPSGAEGSPARIEAVVRALQEAVGAAVNYVVNTGQMLGSLADDAVGGVASAAAGAAHPLGVHLSAAALQPLQRLGEELVQALSEAGKDALLEIQQRLAPTPRPGPARPKIEESEQEAPPDKENEALLAPAPSEAEPPQLHADRLLRVSLQGLAAAAVFASGVWLTARQQRCEEETPHRGRVAISRASGGLGQG
jgi:FG-GAP-like repeat